LFDIIIVYFIAMTMALMHDPGAIHPLGQAALIEYASLFAQTHRPAQVVTLRATLYMSALIRPFGNQGNHRMGCILYYLGGVCAFQLGAVPREIDHRCMQPVTDAEIGYFVLSSITRSENLAFKTPAAKTAWHQDCGCSFKQARTLGLQLLSIDVIDVDLSLGLDTRMGNGFDQ
jgi:hypothetical protein